MLYTYINISLFLGLNLIRYKANKGYKINICFLVSISIFSITLA